MATQPKPLSYQLPLRFDDETKAALQADAEANGRTVSQSARHLLRGALGLGPRTDAPIPSHVHDTLRRALELYPSSSPSEDARVGGAVEWLSAQPVAPGTA